MKIIKVIFALGAVFLIFQNAHAQTTISNTPSTDVIETGNSYLKVGFTSHFDKYRNGGFQTYSLRSIYGLRRNLEIGANVYYTRDGGKSPGEFSPNAKWKAYFHEKHKLTVSAGAVAFIPVRNEKGARPTALVFSNVSKEFSYANGFRLTGGFYTVVGAKREDGNRKGLMIGYEQTLYKKVSLLADYTSGKNRFGYTGVGLSIPFSKKNVFYAGYSFGNTGRSNNWLSLTYGKFF